MAKTTEGIEREFIDGLKERTGRDLMQWMTAIKSKGNEKRNYFL